MARLSRYSRRMRIIINGRFLAQRRTGIQRYALETLIGLDELLVRSELGKTAEVIIAAPRGTVGPKLSAIRMIAAGPFSGHLWEQLTLPLLCGGSLLVGFGPTGPLIKKHQVVTVHDAAIFAVPHTFGWLFRSFYRWLVPLLVKRARYLVTVSEFSKCELTRLLGNEMAAARISGEGWQHVLRIEPDERVLDTHALRGRRYVLVVGSITPHKNLAVVARAAQMLDNDLGVQVVVAGQVNQAVFGKAEAPSAPVLRLIGYVSDAELRALYEHAEVFVHPSRYEGFGIPPLEAMALGCPVIASNAAAIPEVCGNGAWYFSPDDAAELARLIRRVLTSSQEREQLVALGRVQAGRHSWTSSAATFLAILEHASSHRRQSKTPFSERQSPGVLRLPESASSHSREVPAIATRVSRTSASGPVGSGEIAR